MPDIAYVPLDPLIINLGQPAGSRFLRFPGAGRGERGAW